MTTTNLNVSRPGNVYKKSWLYVGDHKTLLLAVVRNNITVRLKPGHQWCWCGVDPRPPHVSGWFKDS